MNRLIMLLVLCLVIPISCAYYAEYSLEESTDWLPSSSDQARTFKRTLNGGSIGIHLENRTWGVLRVWLIIDNQTKDTLVLPMKDIVISDESGLKQIDGCSLDGRLMRPSDTALIAPSKRSRVFVGANLTSEKKRVWSDTIGVIMPTLASRAGSIFFGGADLHFLRKTHGD